MLEILNTEKLVAKGLLLLGLYLAPLSAVGQSTLTLAWDPNQEPDLAGYRCYYGEYGTTPVQVDVGIQTRATLTSLIPGTTYLFYVTAYNTAGLESEPSETITYTIPLPTGTPTLTTLQKAAGGGFAINGTGVGGTIYILQAKDEVTASEWVTIDSDTADASGNFSIQDPIADLPRRFYRVLRQ